MPMGLVISGNPPSLWRGQCALGKGTGGLGVNWFFLGKGILILVLTVPLTGCVSLSKALNLSESQKRHP